MENRTERYIYIDLIKTIAISFVVAYHFWYGSDIVMFENLGLFNRIHRLCYGLLSTCVPLFFIANGALLLNKPFNISKHYKTIFKFAYQLFIWRLITIFLLAIINNVDFNLFPKNELFSMIFLFGWTDLVRTHHLWFIPMLMAIHMMFPFLKGIFDKCNTDFDSRKVLIISMANVFFLSFVLHDIEIFKYINLIMTNINTWSITSMFDPFAKNVGAMLIYFVIGGFIHKYRDNFIKIPMIYCCLSIALGMMLSYTGWQIISKYVGYAYDNVFNGYASIATLICTVSITIIAIKVEPHIMKKSILLLHFISSNTLSIYYIHWILGYYISPYLYYFFGDVLLLGSVSNIFITVIIVTLSVCIGNLIKKIPLFGKYLL